MHTRSLAKLKTKHEKDVDAFVAQRMVAFTERAKWLIAQIQRDLPIVGGIVSCNGHSWLVPVGYPKTREAQIDYVQGPDREGAGEVYRDRLAHAFGFTTGSDEPKVPARCLAHLRELDELATYCESARFHTLHAIATI